MGAAEWADRPAPRGTWLRPGVDNLRSCACLGGKYGRSVVNGISMLQVKLLRPYEGYGRG
ncbi:MAG: hypothetical protein ACYCZF_17405 [Anaerolineae bacterium]